MKIRTICWARNECDVLEAFVRHHAQFSEVLIVLHRCRDNSEEILTSLKKEGLPVTWRTDERLAHEQAEVMTGLMFEAFANGVDWALPLDADEFLVGDVAQTLASHPDGEKVIRVPWKGYVPLPGDDPKEPNVLRRITHHRSKEVPQWCKMLVPRTAFSPFAKVRLGNHAVFNSAGDQIDSFLTPLTLCHFPIRSIRQMTRKICVGWLAYCANPARKPGESFQWKGFYDQLKAGRILNAADLQTMATEYATQTQWASLPKDFTGPEAIADENAGPITVMRDPVPCGFDIRYPIRDADPMNALLESAEDIAMAYGELRKKTS